jgi:hypothetical protein
MPTRDYAVQELGQLQEQGAGELPGREGRERHPYPSLRRDCMRASFRNITKKCRALRLATALTKSFKCM